MLSHTRATPHAPPQQQQPTQAVQQQPSHHQGILVEGSGSPPPAKRRRRGAGPEDRSCPHCGRIFKRTEHLERHVRTHTKEKPFICHCSASFTRRDLLTRHNRLAHGEDLQTSPGDGPDSAPSSVEQQPAEPVHAPPPPPPPTREQQQDVMRMDVNQWPQPVHHPSQNGEPLYPMTNGHQQMPHDVAPPYHNGMMAVPFFDNGAQDGMGFDVQFREFANFLDGVGLPAEWSPFFTGPDKDEHVDPTMREAEMSPAPKVDPGRPGTPFSSWLPSAPSRNRANQNLPETESRGESESHHPYRVTDEQRGRLVAAAETFRNVLEPDFRFPSRHALSRYITSFFEGFHSHMPFIHSPTWKVTEHSLELILAIAALGCQYCFEHRNSERMFFAGKAILMERLRHESHHFGPRTRSHIGIHDLDERLEDPRVARDWGPWTPLETIRALILLMGYATWECKISLLQEAFALQGLLAHVLRDVGLNDEPDNPQAGWLEWVGCESMRRTKLIAFSFLHTHSIAYNVYPVLRSNEVNLRLPCSTKEWKASSPAHWEAARRDTPKEQLFFQVALSHLLKKTDGSAALDPLPTPLGNYVLLHGLLQRIFIVRDLSLPVMDHSAALPAEEVDKLETGLRSWTSGWQQAPESSLDPNNENGPIPFTSSSLLGLAYVRIYLHLGPYRQLETRDPHRIAKALSRSPKVDRSDGVISALLYATHMLSIPVRLGVDRVAKSQAFFWSVRHSLSGLECAVLLSKWLLSLADSAATPLTDSEDRIVHWVSCIVDEALSVVDLEEPPPEGRDASSLGIAVLMIWAHFFKSNTQWRFINVIGRSLEEYRGMLLGRKAA